MPEAGFYEEMLGVSEELFEAFQQDAGNIYLVRESSAPTSGRAHDVTIGSPVKTLLQAVAIPVQKKYIDGQLITGRETQVMFSPPTLTPEPGLSDKIEISGRDRKVIKMKRIPDAGIALVFIFFVAD